jgi:hypothetical protein
VNEDATYTATLTQGGRTVATLTGTAKAYYKPGLNFRLGKLLPSGTYQFTVVVKAATNPTRTTTLTSKSFTIGSVSSAAQAKAKGKTKAKGKPKAKGKLKPKKKK